MYRALEPIQAVFAAALRDADSVPVLLPELDARDPRTVERVALYRGNLWAIWKKALANTFPVVFALVGDEFLGGLARAYGRSCPSHSGDLNRFGADFADFLSTFPHVQSLPYLADVARLEWAVHLAYHAADAQALAREPFAALPPEDLLARRFSLHPACTWIKSRYPIATIWLAHQVAADMSLPQTLEQPEHALIVRPQWQVQVLVSSAAEFAVLNELHAGRRMAQAIKAALQRDRNFNFADALLRWFDNGVLVT